MIAEPGCRRYTIETPHPSEADTVGVRGQARVDGKIEHMKEGGHVVARFLLFVALVIREPEESLRIPSKLSG